MNNPWGRVKHKWKLKSGKSGTLDELEGAKITPEDIEEARKAPEEDKKKLRMQYFFDRAEQENEESADEIRPKYGKYTT